MKCPLCKVGKGQTGTLSHKDELGVVQEPYCFCFKCDKDITEGVVDEWVIRYSEGRNKKDEKRS